jgi:hypothetical protein
VNPTIVTGGPILAATGQCLSLKQRGNEPDEQHRAENNPEGKEDVLE